MIKLLIVILLCSQLTFGSRNHCMDVQEGEIFNIENSIGNASLVEGNIEQNAYYFQESMKQSQSSQKMEFGNSDLSIAFSIKFNIFDYGQDIIFEMIDNQGYSDLELAIYKKQIIMKQFGNVVCQFPELTDIEENSWISYSISLLNSSNEIVFYKNGIAQKCLHSDYIRFSKFIPLNRQERIINIGVKKYKDEVQKYLNNAEIEGFKIYDQKLNIQQVKCLFDICDYQCGDKCYLQSDICIQDQLCGTIQYQQEQKCEKNSECQWNSQDGFCSSNKCEIKEELIQDLDLQYNQQTRKTDVKHVVNFEFKLNKFLENKDSDCFYQGYINLFNYDNQQFENINDFPGVYVQNLEIQSDIVKFQIDYDKTLPEYFRNFGIYIQFQIKTQNQIVVSWIIALRNTQVVYIQKENQYKQLQKEEAYFRKHKQVISNTYEVKKETMNEFKMEIKNDFLSTYYEIQIKNATLIREQDGQDLSDQVYIDHRLKVMVVPKISEIGSYILKVSGVLEGHKNSISPLYQYERYVETEITVQVVEEVKYHKYYYEYFYSERPNIYIIIYDDIFDEDFDYELAIIIALSAMFLLAIAIGLYKCRGYRKKQGQLQVQIDQQQLQQQQPQQDIQLQNNENGVRQQQQELQQWQDDIENLNNNIQQQQQLKSEIKSEIKNQYEDVVVQDEISSKEVQKQQNQQLYSQDNDKSQQREADEQQRMNYLNGIQVNNNND